MSADRIHLRTQDAEPREWIGVVQENGTVKITEGKVGKSGRSQVIGAGVFKAKTAQGELKERAKAKMLQGYITLSWDVKADGEQPEEAGYYFSVVDAGNPRRLERALWEISNLEEPGLLVTPLEVNGQSVGWVIDLGMPVKYDPTEPGPQIKCMPKASNKLATQFFGIVAKAGQQQDIAVSGSDDEGTFIGMADFYQTGDEIDPRLVEFARAIGAIPKPLTFNTPTRNGQAFQAAVF